MGIADEYGNQKNAIEIRNYKGKGKGTILTLAADPTSAS